MLDFISPSALHVASLTKEAENAILSSVSGFFEAGDERIELPPKVLETPIIPFDQSPVPLSATALK